MAGINNSSETLERIYKTLNGAQDLAFDSQRRLLAQVNGCTQSWNDDNFEQFADEIDKSAKELQHIVKALSNAAESIYDLKKRLVAYEQFRF